MTTYESELHTTRFGTHEAQWQAYFSGYRCVICGKKIGERYYEDDETP